MTKQKKNAGFTLIEMLVALLIMVFLVLGMGVGMDAGSRIYRDANFESDSATLAGILNTSLGDILRYSINVKETDPVPAGTDEETAAQIAEDDVDFVFTSLDYGIQDAYFYTPIGDDGTVKGVLQMKNLRNNKVVELVNSGAYPELVVSNFSITYSPRVAPGVEGGYFEISYIISSASDSEKTREVSTIVRLMND